MGAIGNIASMLDSTFFAITSSFRAILGVAANFGIVAVIMKIYLHFASIAFVFQVDYVECSDSFGKHLLYLEGLHGCITSEFLFVTF